MLSAVDCCPSTSSKDFSSETTAIMSFKFHMQPSANKEKTSIHWSHDQDGRNAYKKKHIKICFSKPLGDCLEIGM